MKDLMPSAARFPKRAARMVTAAVAAVSTGAPMAAWGQGVTLVPGLTIEETLTDNREQRTVDRRGDLITRVSPSLSLSSRQGALQGFLNYSLNGVVYAQDSSLNNVFHSLAAMGKLSLLDGRAGVDATANAGRQIISAFGTQSVSSVAGRSNQAQVFSYGIAPYVTGRLLGDVNYQARVAVSGSKSDAQVGEDPMTVTGSAGLSGRLGRMGWGFDASHQRVEAARRAATQNSRAIASLNYAPDVEWLLRARLGAETDNTRTGQSERTDTWGAGFTWLPGPRSVVRFDIDQRFFGRSHSLSISHRMARTVWTLSDSRSLNTSGLSGRAELSNYEFYSQLFASLPDAIRDTVVRDYLAQRNLDPSGRATTGGFLSNGPTVQRSQNLSMAYQGLRATFTVTAFQTRSSSASELNDAGGDLANGNEVQQRGLSMSWIHRLTEGSSVVITGSLQKTPSAGTRAGNDLRSITATWSARLGRYSNVNLSVRHSQFDSDVNPYQESAVIGSIRMQF